MPDLNEVKPEGEWQVETPGRPNCKHRWTYGVSFLYHARVRQCDRSRCREKQVEVKKGA